MCVCACVCVMESNVFCFQVDASSGVNEKFSLVFFFRKKAVAN